MINTMRKTKNFKLNISLVFFPSVLLIYYFINSQLSERNDIKFPIDFDINDTKTTTYDKYVLYECHSYDLCGGLADRFKGVLDAFAWSLFTNRTLAVNISKPCNFERLLEPNKVNWNISFDNLVKNGLLDKNYRQIEIAQIDNPTIRQTLASLDIQKYFKNAHVIKLFTNLEWMSAYSENMFVYF